MLYRDWLTFGNENLEELFLLSAKEVVHSSVEVQRKGGFLAH